MPEDDALRVLGGGWRPVEVGPKLLADTVEEIARRSRRSFGWCRTCRTVNRAEHMRDRLECRGCASDYRGVAY